MVQHILWWPRSQNAWGVLYSVPAARPRNFPPQTPCCWRPTKEGCGKLTTRAATRKRPTDIICNVSELNVLMEKWSGRAHFEVHEIYAQENQASSTFRIGIGDLTILSCASTSDDAVGVMDSEH
ncbi:hypothetical protein BAUCODRAFT_234275 [Baudoinia panamericana UAMH 10762]|uniref:Uncharacterized protein n=1 Tax=Baudoinia panamericana (strain UAMH 10762) TaxID=717646 RepID=M2M9W6_BAUPA|nr:uncharacterized protein BAUCODRAFT_234275 [Baudoinia panamericana UAMH 10762]EMC93246.1 hypothetical protein BAUCODRAFT_234275 [Baudoinia panamericana UAMH 10762]